MKLGDVQSFHEQEPCCCDLIHVPNYSSQVCTNLLSTHNGYGVTGSLLLCQPERTFASPHPPTKRSPGHSLFSAISPKPMGRIGECPFNLRLHPGCLFCPCPIPPNGLEAPSPLHKIPYSTCIQLSIFPSRGYISIFFIPLVGKAASGSDGP
jgi:hypothetical protein